MQHSAMPVAAFLAVVLVFFPFAVQQTLFRRQYFPSFLIALWLLLANIIFGVNSLVWAGDAAVHIPVWCDITTKILIGVSYAIPACLFSVSTRLRLAASRNLTQVQRSERERRDALILDIALCVGIPIVAMVIHTVVQGHRFDIIETIGCQPEIPAVSAGTVFFWLPALVLNLLSFSLCCSSWRTIIGPERSWLQLYIANFDSTLTVRLFFSHFMLVVCVAFLWAASLVITIYESLTLDTATGTNRTTIDWSRVDSYTLADFSPLSRRNRLFCWWTIPATAFIFSFWFILFPAAAQLEGLYYRAHYYIGRRRVAKNSIITLRDLKAGESTPSRVIVRKCSTVEITVDDYVLPTFTEHARSYSTSPFKGGYEPRWSVPWEYIQSPISPLHEQPTVLGERGSQNVNDDFIIKDLPIISAEK